MYTQSTENYFNILLGRNDYDTESEDDEQKGSTIAISKPDESHCYHCTVAECQRVYKSKNLFQKHLASHYCESVFKCRYDDCYKVYKSKENLTLHIKNKHLGFKPYSCSFCFKVFSHRNGKLYHERKVHMDLMNQICISNINLYRM
jgi:hypothetical protein